MVFTSASLVVLVAEVLFLSLIESDCHRFRYRMKVRDHKLNIDGFVYFQF